MQNEFLKIRFNQLPQDRVFEYIKNISLCENLKINDETIINELISSKKIIKVLHSCKEDIEAIYKWSGVVLNNIFDTQLAEAFLGKEFSISYQSLVFNNLDLHLKKDETRSNWIRRPLRESQLDYAASDVEFLIHLYENQTKKLRETDKIDWLREELNFITERVLEDLPAITEPLRKITTNEEDKIIRRFNDQVIKISQIQKINPTLFFSKRNQKHFIRYLIDLGDEEALSQITQWRASLIKEIISDLV